MKFLKKYAESGDNLKFASLYYFNYLVSGITSIWATRLLGPTDRGIFAKYLLLFFAFQLTAEMGLNGATTHFCSNKKEFAKSLHRLLMFKMLQNSIGFLCIFLLINSFFHFISFQNFLFLGVSHLVILIFTISLPILLGIDVYKWSVINLIQPFIYALMIIFLSFSQLTALKAVLAVNLSYIPQGLIAYFIVRGIDLPEIKLKNLPVDLRIFARQNLIWTLTSTIFARVDVIILSVLSSNFFLGMYSTAVGWLLLSSPVLNSFSTRKFTELSGKRKIAREDFLNEFKSHLFITIGLSLILILVGKFILLWMLGNQFEQIENFLFPVAIIVFGKLVSNALAQISRSVGRPAVAAKWEFFLISTLCMSAFIWRDLQLVINMHFLLLLGIIINIFNYLQFRDSIKDLI